MKSAFPTIRAAVFGTLMLALICCGVYPLAVTVIGQLLFRDKANGSLLVDISGSIAGSSLLGQNFTGEGYFHSRPSAAGINGYDALNSGGSNAGPTSQALADSVKQRVANYRALNGLENDQPVPADAVTASGSGLDPHISTANAALQLARVCRARSLPPDMIRQLITANTDKADFGVLGSSGVNVLKLNLALDAIK